ncbi:hypothetical protein Rs2_46258 [Raphanus sativus]|nr:hypothetical protein Rs2_46258 [Raphanus sativus]
MGLFSLSPANSACLTTSLSRRLRTSNSVKNVSAGVVNFPMFGANGGRKRSGSGHVSKHVEPSSPKVTCIGQVRVKTSRKRAKEEMMRARSRSLRRSSSDQNDGGGRRFDGSENRWVHLPVTICESLRELSCLFPCRSSCTDDDDNNTHHDERGRSGGNSCVAVFTRWFVAVEETTGGERRELELVVGGGGGGDDARRRSRRRHVFENLDLSVIETKTVKEEIIVGPPKNALLLMRCRSDPVKVAALANRVRERQMSLNDVAYGREDEEDVEIKRFEIELREKCISDRTIAVPVSEPEALSVEEEASKIQDVDSFEEETEATIIKTIEDDIRNAIEEEERKEAERSDQEPDPTPEVVMEKKTEEDKTTPYKVLPDCLLLMMCEPKLSMEVSKETWVCSTDFVRCQPSRPPARKIVEPAGDHHHHHHQSKKRTVDSNVSSRRISVDKPPVHQAPLLQPPRSSCSYPAAPPEIQAAAAVGEENKAYEPPMLPRCKSEPRKSALKLTPETCLWKNRKLEPHSPAAVGVGAAGVGF